MDDDSREHNERKKNSVLCCDEQEVAKIIACLCELKHTIECVIECTHDHSSANKERIILCILLDEIRRIEAKLDNPLFGLKEIKHEIIEINNIITNSTFGLREIKNEVQDVESLLTNQFFGLNEIKNEIITINDLLNNTSFGIPELKNEIRIIENSTALTNNLLTNQIFGLNEIKNEIRLIENQSALLTNTVFGLNEIKNEIKGIENKLDDLIPTPCSLLTTGPVITDKFAKSVVTKVYNLTNQSRTIFASLQDLTQCPPNSIASIPFNVPSCCANDAIFSNAPAAQFEVTYNNIVPGIFVFTAARTEITTLPINQSTLIPSNTFRHADHVCRNECNPLDG